MTTIADISTTTDRMRETLSLALNTLDQLGMEPWSVECLSGGEYLRIYLADHDAEDAGRRLFAALGGHRCTESRQEKNWAIFSSGLSEWANPPQDYARANIPFGDRMIEVHIICTTSPSRRVTL